MYRGLRRCLHPLLNKLGNYFSFIPSAVLGYRELVRVWVRHMMVLQAESWEMYVYISTSLYQDLLNLRMSSCRSFAVPVVTGRQ